VNGLCRNAVYVRWKATESRLFVRCEIPLPYCGASILFRQTQQNSINLQPGAWHPPGHRPICHCCLVTLLGLLLVVCSDLQPILQVDNRALQLEDAVGYTPIGYVRGNLDRVLLLPLRAAAGRGETGRPRSSELLRGPGHDWALAQVRLYGLNLRGLELAVVELGVEAAAGQQILVLALFDDVAVVHHHNQVRVADGGQTVRDDETGAILHQLVHGFPDQDFGAGIDRAGGSVLNQHGGTEQHGAGDGQKLPMTPGHRRPLALRLCRQ